MGWDLQQDIVEDVVMKAEIAALLPVEPAKSVRLVIDDDHLTALDALMVEDSYVVIVGIGRLKEEVEATYFG